MICAGLQRTCLILTTVHVRGRGDSRVDTTRGASWSWKVTARGPDSLRQQLKQQRWLADMIRVDLKHMLAVNPQRSKPVIIPAPLGHGSYSMLFSNQSNFNLLAWARLSDKVLFGFLSFKDVEFTFCRCQLSRRVNFQVAKAAQAISEARWDKNKSICSSSPSQLSGQICQIAFVTLAVLAVCICHCAEVWFLADIMRPGVIACSEWTEHAPALWPPSPLSLILWRMR